MRTSHRWLIAGVMGASLVSPGIARAGGARGAPTEAPLGGTGTMPGTTRTTERRATTGSSFQAPSPIRVGQPLSVLAFPFAYKAADTGTPGAPGAPGAMPAAPGANPAMPTDMGAAGGAASMGGAALTAEQQETAEQLTAAVKAGFLASPHYNLASFTVVSGSTTPNSPLILRARKDDILKNEHLTGLVVLETGGVDEEKARVVTYRLGIQALLVGSFEMTTDPKTNTVEITLETQLINSTTGEVIRAAAVSGSAAGAEGVPLYAIRQRAVIETAQKVYPAMGLQLVPTKQAIEEGQGPKKQQRDHRGSRRASAEPAQPQSKLAQPESKPEKAESQPEKSASVDHRGAPKAARRTREEAKAAEKSRRDAEKEADTRTLGTAETGETTPAPAPTNECQADQPPAKPAAPAAPGSAQPMPGAQPEAPAVAPGSVPAASDLSGMPVPYGYAMTGDLDAIPRNRRGLRVPAWLGLAAFLTGISFLAW